MKAKGKYVVFIIVFIISVVTLNTCKPQDICIQCHERETQLAYPTLEPIIWHSMED